MAYLQHLSVSLPFPRSESLSAAILGEYVVRGIGLQVVVALSTVAVGPNGDTSHMAQRATRINGLSESRSGSTTDSGQREPSTATTQKTAGQPSFKGAKGSAAAHRCVSPAREGGRNPSGFYR